MASLYLLSAALIMAALAGLTDFLGDRRIRSLSAAWHHIDMLMHAVYHVQGQINAVADVCQKGFASFQAAKRVIEAEVA